MSTTLENTANKVTELRLKLGFDSVKKFADFLQIGYTTVHNWEKRGNLPDAQNIAKIIKKIPDLNPAYFADNGEPAFISNLVDKNDSSPLSVRNSAILEGGGNTSENAGQEQFSEVASLLQKLNSQISENKTLKRKNTLLLRVLDLIIKSGALGDLSDMGDLKDAVKLFKQQQPEQQKTTAGSKPSKSAIHG